jgi:hypothetical protein
MPPVTIDGTSGITTPMYGGAITANAVTPVTGFKSRIINGNMVIDQRNAGASVTPTTDATYTLDRWCIRLTQASKFSVQQNAGSVTPPVGFTNYLGITSTSSYSVSSTDIFTLEQIIEGFNVQDLAWGTANAKTVTLSFQVYSSKTGTFGGSLFNNAANRSYPFTYTIASANTWTSVSVTIAGDTSGSWTQTNGAGIYVNFDLGSGTSRVGTAGAWAGATYWGASGCQSIVATNGATFYITGCQLEVGSTATSFDYRPYGTELALAQRYYQQINGNNVVGTALYGMMGSGIVFNSTSADISIPLKVSMRATPTLVQSNTTIQVGGTLYTTTSVSDAGSTPNVVFARVGNAGSMTVGYGANLSSNNSTSGYFSMSAEL